MYTKSEMQRKEVLEGRPRRRCHPMWAYRLLSCFYVSHIFTKLFNIFNDPKDKISNIFINDMIKGFGRTILWNWTTARLWILSTLLRKNGATVILVGISKKKKTKFRNKTCGFGQEQEFRVLLCNYSEFFYTTPWKKFEFSNCDTIFDEIWRIFRILNSDKENRRDSSIRDQVSSNKVFRWISWTTVFRGNLLQNDFIGMDKNIRVYVGTHNLFASLSFGAFWAISRSLDAAEKGCPSERFLRHNNNNECEMIKSLYRMANNG